MNIAFEYAKLCEDEEVKAIYETILNEWQVTKEVILAIEVMMNFWLKIHI